MPDIIKVTDLTELTTPADGDFVPIVDISEPIDIDKTKKISVLNLVVAKITAAFAAYAPTLISRRQGGSSTDWNLTGSTNYTPTAANVKIQAGSRSLQLVATYYTTVAITFPVAYTNKPIVITSGESVLLNGTTTWSAENITNTGFDLRLNVNLSTNSTKTGYWIAIGE